MQGIVCPSLLLARPLGGFYVTNITDPMPFTGVIETTALVDRAAFGGRSLVYLPKYVPADDPHFAEPDAALKARFLTQGELDRLETALTAKKPHVVTYGKRLTVFDLETYQKVSAGMKERKPWLKRGQPAKVVVHTH